MTTIGELSCETQAVLVRYLGFWEGLSSSAALARDINQPIQSCHTADCERTSRSSKFPRYSTLLHYAVHVQNFDAVVELCQKGANINAIDSITQKTPLALEYTLAKQFCQIIRQFSPRLEYPMSAIGYQLFIRGASDNLETIAPTLPNETINQIKRRSSQLFFPSSGLLRNRPPQHSLKAKHRLPYR